MVYGREEPPLLDSPLLLSLSKERLEERDFSPVIARDRVPKQSLGRFGTGSAVAKRDCFAPARQGLAGGSLAMTQSSPETLTFEVNR